MIETRLNIFKKVLDSRTVSHTCDFYSVIYRDIFQKNIFL